MKMILPLFFIMMSFISFSQEKTEKYSFHVGAGLLSARYLDKSGPPSPQEGLRSHICPVFNIGLQARHGKWRAGPGFSYDHFGPKDRSTEFSTLSYYLAADRSWNENGGTRIYSGFSLGISVCKKLEDQRVLEKEVKPCFQVVVIGTEFRLNRFSVHLDLGYGMAGMVNGKLRYHFY